MWKNDEAYYILRACPSLVTRRDRTNKESVCFEGNAKCLKICLRFVAVGRQIGFYNKSRYGPTRNVLSEAVSSREVVWGDN